MVMKTEGLANDKFRGMLEFETRQPQYREETSSRKRPTADFRNLSETVFNKIEEKENFNTDMKSAFVK